MSRIMLDGCKRSISTKEINMLVNTEMDANCHDDYIEDYETPLDFYLSNVIKDSYATDYLPSVLTEEYDDMTYREIQVAVMQEIVKRF